MSIIELNKDNIEKEHICCALSDKKGENCVSNKKTWLKEQFEKGLVFKKLDERAKVFIEYIPAENAYAPIKADNYMYINCFWVSGKFKNQGYGNMLLDECISDAKTKNKSGLVVLSSKKKMPFLSDPKYLKYKGFKICDTCDPYYELLYLPFEETAIVPKFADSVKIDEIEQGGIVLYYTNQCPHTEKYAYLIRDAAIEHNLKFTLIQIKTAKQAQNAPKPFTTYSLFVGHKFVTNEILTQKKFLKLVESK